MASRHLAAEARGRPRTTYVYGRSSQQVSQPVILHWLGECSTRRCRLLGQRRRRDGDRDVPRPGQRPRREGRRRQGVAARPPSTRLGLRAALPGRGPALHRRRLQLPGADRRRRHAPLRRAAGRSSPRSLRRPPRRCRPRRRRPSRRTTRRWLRPARSRHLFEAPTFYYKTGIAFLSWLNGHQRGFTMVGGLQSARSALHLGRVLSWPTTPGCCSIRSWPPPGCGPGSRGRGAMTAELDVPSPAGPGGHPGPGDPRLARLSLNQRTTKRWTLREAVTGCRSGRAPEHRPVAGAGRRGGPRDRGRELAARRGPARVLASAAAGSSPRRTPVSRPRTTTTGGPSRRPRRSGHPRWCWSSAACRRATRDLVGARERVAERDRRAGARSAGQHGVRLVLEPLHPMYARRPRRSSRPWARPSTSPQPHPARASSVSWSTPSTSGGTRTSPIRSPAPGERIASYQVCDWSPRSRRTRCSSRGMMGDGAHRLPSFTPRRRRDRLHRRRRGRDLQRRHLGGAGDEVVATLARRYIELVEPFLTPPR